MKKVYIVIVASTGNVQYSVSSEGYDSYEKAVEFIEGRSGSPEFVPSANCWVSRDDRNVFTTYAIKEIDVK